MKTDKDTRFSVPLYTVAEAAQFLGVPSSALSAWSRGYVRRPAGRAVVRGEAHLEAGVRSPSEAAG